MADETLRRAERAWRTNDRGIAALAAAHARAGRDLPLEALRETPRWRRLADFVDGWFQEPLGERDGVSPDAIAAVEERLGHRLPAALREWHRLAGRRVRALPGRCRPVPLEQTRDRDLLLLYERPGFCSWRAGVRAGEGAEDDPPVIVDREGDVVVVPRVSDFLFAITVRELLQGLSSPGRHGSFGRTGTQVGSGRLRRADALQAARDTFAPLLERSLDTELDDEPDVEVRGDADTILRLKLRGIGAGLVTWVTRTPAARARLSALLDLAEDPTSIVYLAFDGLPLDERDRLAALVASSVDALGDPDVRVHGERVELELPMTLEWRASFERALELFAPWQPWLQAARRPVNVDVFHPLWPADLDEFWPPAER
jgi:hypothetical protein